MDAKCFSFGAQVCHQFFLIFLSFIDKNYLDGETYHDFNRISHKHKSRSTLTPLHTHLDAN